jgi:4-alpha-glucanotransferase
MRAASLSVARLAVFPMQDVLGLPSSERMNTPGTLGGSNWTWRFDWTMVGEGPGLRLGRLGAASGRAPFGLLRL